MSLPIFTVAYPLYQISLFSPILKYTSFTYFTERSHNMISNWYRTTHFDLELIFNCFKRLFLGAFWLKKFVYRCSATCMISIYRYPHSIKQESYHFFICYFFFLKIWETKTRRNCCAQCRVILPIIVQKWFIISFK